MSCGNRCGGSCCGGCGSCGCCGDWGLLPGTQAAAFTLADAMLEFDKRYDKRYLQFHVSRTTDLADVSASPRAAHGYGLVWDARAGKWIPSPVVTHTQWLPPVASSADLANINNPDDGDVVLTQLDMHLHIWDGAQWQDFQDVLDIPVYLTDLNDVHIPAPKAGEVLTFDPTLGAHGQWISQPAVHTTQFRGSVATTADLATIATPKDGDLAATVTPQELHLYAGGKWNSLGAIAAPLSKVQDGTAAGQFPVWDPPLGKYVPADFPIPPGGAAGDVLEWNATALKWEAKASPAAVHHMGTEDNVAIPLTGADQGVPVYDDPTDSFMVRRLKVEDLVDIDSTVVPNDGDLLVWNKTTNQWEYTEKLSADPMTPHPNEFGFSLFSNPANGPTLEATVKNMLGGVHVYEDGILVLYTNSPNDVRYAWIDGSGRNQNVVWDGASITRHQWGAASALTGVVLADGTVPMAADLSLGGHKGTNVLDPVANSDAANKHYVDTQVARAIQGSLQQSVKAILATPPAAPADLDMYIVGPGATGAWAGETGNVATWDATSNDWLVDAPTDGDTRLVELDHKLYRYNATTQVWSAVAATAPTGGVPVGTIIMWPTLVPPAGFQMCDGSTFNKATYPELFAVLGVAEVPDMRGHFVRGWSTDNTQGDPNGPKHPGDTANDTTRMPRRHPFVNDTTGAHFHRSGDFHVATPNDYGAESGAYPNHVQGEVGWGQQALKPFTSTEGAHTHNLTGGDEETRPINIVMAFAIKATP